MPENQALIVDPEIRSLVEALQKVGIETDWSCAGSDDDHMTIRITVEARTGPFWLHLGAWPPHLWRQKRSIEQVMAHFGISDYWLSLVFTYGDLNSHGGEPTWLIQIPGRFDFLSLPVAYSIQYVDDKEDLVIGYRPPDFYKEIEHELYPVAKRADPVRRG